MYRATFLLLAPLLSTAALAQSAPPDSPALQSLVAEIHQLRQELQTTAATIQRVQLMMFRLQSQTALATRATQRLDDAKSRCVNAQNQRKMTATELERFEQMARLSQNPTERKIAEDNIPRIKANMEMWTNQDQQCQSTQADAESQFRTEQAKLTDLQDQMDKLDRVLDGFSKK